MNKISPLRPPNPATKEIDKLHSKLIKYNSQGKSRECGQHLAKNSNQSEGGKVGNINSSARHIPTKKTLYPIDKFDGCRAKVPERGRRIRVRSIWRGKTKRARGREGTFSSLSPLPLSVFFEKKERRVRGQNKPVPLPPPPLRVGRLNGLGPLISQAGLRQPAIFITNPEHRPNYASARCFICSKVHGKSGPIIDLSGLARNFEIPSPAHDDPKLNHIIIIKTVVRTTKNKLRVVNIFQ